MCLHTLVLQVTQCLHTCQDLGTVYVPALSPLARLLVYLKGSGSAAEQVLCYDVNFSQT